MMWQYMIWDMLTWLHEKHHKNYLAAIADVFPSIDWRALLSRQSIGFNTLLMQNKYADRKFRFKILHNTVKRLCNLVEVMYKTKRKIQYRFCFPTTNNPDQLTILQKQNKQLNVMGSTSDFLSSSYHVSMLLSDCHHTANGTFHESYLKGNVVEVGSINICFLCIVPFLEDYW